ncbi:hypothetical protein JCM10207_007386 [Rhodosporidiobolus poonsookiae]
MGSQADSPTHSRQAPKRKAATQADAPAPKKRTTRASTSTADSPQKTSTKFKGASKAKATPTKAKGKSKKREEIVIGSSDVEPLPPRVDSDDSDVQIETPPKKKKAAAPKKKDTKPATTKKSKAAIAAQTPLSDADDSPSTPRDLAPAAAASKPKPKAAAKKSKPAPFEQAFPEWWACFAEEDEPDKMGGEGIERLFEEMGVSMEGVHPFLLAYKVKAPPGSFGTFRKEDFESAFRSQKISSSEQLKTELDLVHQNLYGPNALDSDFGAFYRFLFAFLKNEGAKSLPSDMAVAVLSVVLKPKFELAEAFVEFAVAQGDKFKAMSNDAWTQLFDFCQQVQPDLTGWSEMDAWPSIIDSFVEWKKSQDAA